MNATRMIRRPEGRRGNEESTRIVRFAVPPQAAEASTRIVRKPVMGPKAASLPARARPWLLPLSRFALVALVLGKERAPELLEGLGGREAARAKEHLTLLMGLSSAERQARVALEFGQRRDAAEQLRAVMQEASEPLRQELFRRLPPYHQSLFPARAAGPLAPAAPGLGVLAERLIREATR
ncbi:hypothetical protein SAMN05444354_106278 [Stigmatella aurantiaca]|uniref:Uncharacterized protein n=1 Tax=Stigmatella aurantiaca TaxID=41 RepID=A0A1H7QUJ6_STIAU|nr:hypothetical protein [Stigmatella aurantiaca]SEL51592.1 hypothetical protein SAMN05444354_106278 [Stigmatella aurantiaca]